MKTHTFILFPVVLLGICCVAHAAEMVQLPGDQRLEMFKDRAEILSLIEADKAPADVLISADWGERNPFDISSTKEDTAEKPVAVARAAEPKDFLLTGIVWGVAKPSAVINDKIILPGGLIEGWTLKEIREGTVVFVKDQQEQVIFMKQ